MASTIYRQGQASSTDVREMQKALKDQGYYKGNVDGIWGNQTSSALSNYKRDTGGSNTAGNSFGRETIVKLFGNPLPGSSGSSSSRGSSSSGGSSSSSSGSGSATGKNTAGTGPAGMIKNALGLVSSLVKAGAQNPGLTAGLYGEYNRQNEQAEMQKYYEDMLAQQEEQYQMQQEAARQRTQATVDSILANREGISQEFEKAQRENYVNRVLQQNQMGDYLSAMGYSGGMSESTLQGIANNYENNRLSAITERDNAYREIEQLAAQARTSGDSDLANIANNYYEAYINTLNNQAQMKYQIDSAQREQMNADRNYLLQLAQQRFAEQQYSDSREDAAASASSEMKQQLAANDFDAFLNTYKGKYTKEATYRKWIENLKKMSDPYGYNKQKIAYLTQYINSGMGKKKSSRTKNGTAVSEDGGEGGRGSAATQSMASYGDFTNALASGQLPYIGTIRKYGDTSAGSVIDYLEDLYSKGAISKSQAQQLAANAGLIT